MKRNLIGQRFGRWTVIAEAQKYRHKVLWPCRCDCGVERLVENWKMRSGGSRSCGCLRRDLRGTQGFKHGMVGTPEYRIWAGMLRRCRLGSKTQYHRYGGRGITVCERWEEFENFYADMGMRPSPNHSIDRINNDGNYEPGNCRWATTKEQGENKCSVRPIGGFPSMAAASRALGVSYNIVCLRISYGWSEERAVNEAVHKKGVL